MTDPNRLGLLLRRHRTEAGLTIDELAAASRVSVRAISDMERGRSRVPQRRTVEALIRAMGLPESAATALRETARSGRRVARTAPTLAPPRAVADFTGRHRELDWLGDRVARSAEPDGLDVGVVAVVSGPPGLGKTALMVQAAARYAGDFPDGVLFVDLRGLDAAPPRPNDLLLRLLTALGMEESRIPRDEHARSAHYRALLRDRRSLLLFDNAADESQVRPLLPGAGTTMTIVTSRRVLAGLEAVDRLSLPALARGEAVTLLQRIIGSGRSAAESDAMLFGLAQACGNLPLALRIVGNRLLSRPDWSIEYLLRRLADQDDRLDLLVAGDLQIAAPFMLSYRQLSGAAARMFRRLSLVPGPDVGSTLAAHAADLGLKETEAALEELADLGLLQPVADGRYRFHDLMRLFARARLAAEETPEARQRAEDRVVTWLLDTAVAAGRWFEPGPTGASAGGGPASAEQASRWIEQEALNWLGALRMAFAAGRHVEVMAVADAMHWFSDRWTHWENWLEVYQMSAASAEALGDPRGQAVHLNYVSWVYTVCAMRPDLAEAPAREALRLAGVVGDSSQQGWAWIYLGSAARRRGDPTAAHAAAGQSLPFFEAVADWDGYAQGLSLLAGSLGQGGRHREAIEQYRRLEALLAAPDRAPSAPIVDLTAGHLHLNIGLSLLALRRWAAAAASFRVALPSLQRSGVRQSEARCRYGLGTALARLGRVDEARGELRRAIRLARHVGAADLVDRVLSRLAELGPPAGRRVS